MDKTNMMTKLHGPAVSSALATKTCQNVRSKMPAACNLTLDGWQTTSTLMFLGYFGSDQTSEMVFHGFAILCRKLRRKWRHSPSPMLHCIETLSPTPSAVALVFGPIFGEKTSTGRSEGPRQLMAEDQLPSFVDWCVQTLEGLASLEFLRLVLRSLSVWHWTQRLCH